jgi:hypothetical protein
MAVSDACDEDERGVVTTGGSSVDGRGGLAAADSRGDAIAAAAVRAVLGASCAWSTPPLRGEEGRRMGGRCEDGGGCGEAAGGSLMVLAVVLAAWRLRLWMSHSKEAKRVSVAMRDER